MSAVAKSDVAVIISKHSFDETMTRLEQIIPPLDTLYQSYIAKGNLAGARAALEALPRLNNFTPPRNFGILLSVFGKDAQSIVYEIGNSLTASKLASHVLEASVGTYPSPITAARRWESAVQIPLLPLLSRYGIKDVDEMAKNLDDKIVSTLQEIASYLSNLREGDGRGGRGGGGE